MKRAVKVFSIIIGFVLLLFACNNTTETEPFLAKDLDSVRSAEMDSSLSKLSDDSNDSIVHHIDSAIVNGQLFKAFFIEKGDLLIRDQNDSIYSPGEFGEQFWFEDFDQDGYKDVRGWHMANNTPGVEDLMLYDVKSNAFRLVENFSRFPDIKRIGQTEYYFSYHKAGCADMTWVSDLMYIENFKAIKIGTIKGEECGYKEGVYISHVIGDSVILVKTLPIRTIYLYKDFKWGFIKQYWNKNYKNFIPAAHKP